MANAISVYGSVTTRKYRIKRTFKDKRRKWVYHRLHGMRGKRWYKPKLTRRIHYTTKPMEARFNFYGAEGAVQKAKRMMDELGLVPKLIKGDRYRSVDANKFIYDAKYRRRVAEEGTWTEGPETKESP